MQRTDEERQREVCARYGATFSAAPVHLKVGVAGNVREGLLPINGLRHPAVGDTTGWYLWAGDGDPSDDPDYFVPVHVEHLVAWCPDAIRFLGLPPGWRFIAAGDYEDVWEDLSLLNFG
jgi:hypothetical protein